MEFDPQSLFVYLTCYRRIKFRWNCNKVMFSLYKPPSPLPLALSLFLILVLSPFYPHLAASSLNQPSYYDTRAFAFPSMPKFYSPIRIMFLFSLELVHCLTSNSFLCMGKVSAHTKFYGRCSLWRTKSRTRNMWMSVTCRMEKEFIWWKLAVTHHLVIMLMILCNRKFNFPRILLELHWLDAWKHIVQSKYARMFWNSVSICKLAIDYGQSIHLHSKNLHDSNLYTVFHGELPCYSLNFSKSSNQSCHCIETHRQMSLTVTHQSVTIEIRHKRNSV